MKLWYALGLVLALAAGVVLGTLWATKPAPAPESPPLALPRIVPFEGEHQAGIATPQPAFAMVEAFDLTTADAGEVRGLFQKWTAAARRLTQGLALDDDTGEVIGYGPSKLTITFGVGPSLFDDRFGWKPLRPDALQPLPEFPNDDLHPRWSDGDLVVQVCGDDMATVYSALHNLSRLAAEVAEARWVQAGFQPVAGVAGPVPRNLQGFHDGTSNPNPLDPKTFDDVVWAGTEAPSWMEGGSYLVVRRIRIFVENWSQVGVLDQERVIGRQRASGETLKKPGDNAHVTLAQGNQKIFRRPFSYFNGLDDETLQWDAGLLFLAWQKDPRTQFVPIQKRLAEYDALNEYTQAVGSAVFAVFPGTAAGHYVGEGLFGHAAP